MHLSQKHAYTMHFTFNVYLLHIFLTVLKETVTLASLYLHCMHQHQVETLGLYRQVSAVWRTIQSDQCPVWRLGTLQLTILHGSPLHHRSHVNPLSAISNNHNQVVIINQPIKYSIHKAWASPNNQSINQSNPAFIKCCINKSSQRYL